jgi:hypothetical protein
VHCRSALSIRGVVRNQRRIPGRRIIGTYGGFEGLYIVIYFTGAVRNEKTSCKAFGSLLTSVCFAVFPE